MKFSELDKQLGAFLPEGTVIPAHPPAFDKHLKLDEKMQRRLTQYYIASRAGGVAVGVHTTQFEIRNRGVVSFESVLHMAAEEVEKAALKRSFIKVAGIVGPTQQAIKGAKLAVQYGYHLGLVSMGGLKDLSEKQLIERARA